MKDYHQKVHHSYWEKLQKIIRDTSIAVSPALTAFQIECMSIEQGHSHSGPSQFSGSHMNSLSSGPSLTSTSVSVGSATVCFPMVGGTGQSGKEPVSNADSTSVSA